MTRLTVLRTAQTPTARTVRPRSLNSNRSAVYGVRSSGTGDTGTLRFPTLTRPQRTDTPSGTPRLRSQAPIAPSGRSGLAPAHSSISANSSDPAAPVDPKQTEAELIGRVQAGDVAAFSGLVHRHLRVAFGIAYHVLQHREDAEDVVQQAFMSALVRIDSFDATRPFGPWFGRVVLNHARSARRARTRIAKRQVEPVDTYDPSPSASPERSAEDAEIRDRVRAAVATLPERQRLAIQLIDVDGYGAAEVAAMLELSPVTMRWHLMAARRTLRRLLAPLANAHSATTSSSADVQHRDRDAGEKTSSASDANKRSQ